MEQNYPTNDYKQKRNPPQEYEQPYQERNAYQKPSGKVSQQSQQIRPQGRQPSNAFEEKTIKEVNR